MIVLDLINGDGILAAAANVDEGLAASSFGFLQAVARARGFEVSQGYADTDHPSMNVYSGEDWTSFVAMTPDPSSDSATFSARATAGPGTSGNVCSSTLYWQVGHTSAGLPICLYWPGLAVPAAALAIVGGLTGSWAWGFGAAALVFFLLPRMSANTAAGTV